MPEPPSHVEEPRVRGRGREPPEHVHVRLGQGEALDVATRAQVLVQGLHPGGLVTNAQDGPVVGSCKDRGTRRQSGAGRHGVGCQALPGDETSRRQLRRLARRRAVGRGCHALSGGWGNPDAGDGRTTPRMHQEPPGCPSYRPLLYHTNLSSIPGDANPPDPRPQPGAGGSRRVTAASCQTRGLGAGPCREAAGRWRGCGHPAACLAKRSRLGRPFQPHLPTGPAPSSRGCRTAGKGACPLHPGVRPLV